MELFIILLLICLIARVQCKGEELHLPFSLQKLSPGYPKFNKHWAGRVYEGGLISYAASIVRVPSILPGSARRDVDEEKSNEWAGEFWIGIDGYSCREAAIRGGITWKRVGNDTRYTAWTQWYPEPRMELDLDIESEDKVQIQVSAPGRLNGAVNITNISTEESVNTMFHGKATPLCKNGADWIVSRVAAEEDSSQRIVYPFAWHSNVVFQKLRYMSDRDGILQSPSGIMLKRVRMGNIRWGMWRTKEAVKCSHTWPWSHMICRHT